MALPFGLRSPFFLRPQRQFTDEQLQRALRNKFNEAFFFGSTGNQVTDDDRNSIKYIDYAYNINPDVYSVVNQIASKFTSIPYVIKDVKDEKSYRKLNLLNKSTNYNYSISQEFKALTLKELSYDEDYMMMPLEQPNVSQTWDEFWNLSEVFLQTTGNVYWHIQKPELRENADPTAIYVLPSHLMEIVLKGNVDLIGDESPIDYYMLREGATYVEFKSNEVIHLKYSNPNYDENGSHLYGQSPLRAGWKNIESTNKGLDLSVNTLKNGGAFGFIHAKDNQTPLTQDQGREIKDRLKEMNKDPEDLGRISGMSAALGFTRISLTPDELKPFDYFKYNLKQVCNVLGWDAKLLNDDDGAKYDNMKVAEKRVVTGKIVPDIRIYEQSFNKFLNMFSGYEGTVIDWQVKALPEMQQDYKTMVDWIEKAVNIGLITRNQGLKVMDMPLSEDTNMDIITVKDDVMTLEDAILPQGDVQI